MSLLKNFKVKKTDYMEFEVESVISGSKAVVNMSSPCTENDLLLWVILNDLYQDGMLVD